MPCNIKFKNYNLASLLTILRSSSLCAVHRNWKVVPEMGKGFRVGLRFRPNTRPLPWYSMNHFFFLWNQSYNSIEPTTVQFNHFKYCIVICTVYVPFVTGSSSLEQGFYDLKILNLSQNVGYFNKSISNVQIWSSLKTQKVFIINTKSWPVHKIITTDFNF